MIDRIFDWWAGLFEGKDREEAIKEWHAFIQGIGLWFWPFPQRYFPSDTLRKEIEGEHHYYVAGHIIGLILLGLIARMIYGWF